MLAAASVVGVRVILRVVVNGVTKVMTACSPADNGITKVVTRHKNTAGYFIKLLRILTFLITAWM